jgi:hypothetical protein
MALRHPFVWLTEAGQARAFVVMALLAIFVMANLQIVGTPLQTSAAPAGIVSFELAGDLPTAKAILVGWDQEAQIHAALSLGADYLFMLTYAVAIGLGCVLVARRLSARLRIWALLGVALAWAQWGAAGLDALENYALIRLLQGSLQTYWPAVARWCAIPKFAVVGVGLVYVAVGGMVALAVRPRAS